MAEGLAEWSGLVPVTPNTRYYPYAEFLQENHEYGKVLLATYGSKVADLVTLAEHPDHRRGNPLKLSANQYWEGDCCVGDFYFLLFPPPRCLPPFLPPFRFLRCCTLSW
jgi:hypothetical protein